MLLHTLITVYKSFVKIIFNLIYKLNLKYACVWVNLIYSGKTISMNFLLSAAVKNYEFKVLQLFQNLNYGKSVALSTKLFFIKHLFFLFFFKFMMLKVKKKKKKSYSKCFCSRLWIYEQKQKWSKINKEKKDVKRGRMEKPIKQ